MHTEVPYNLQSSRQTHASLRELRLSPISSLLNYGKAQYIFIFIFSQHMASQEFQNLVSVLFQQEQLSTELKLWGQSCFIRKPLLLGCQGGWDNGRATNKGARVVPLPARSPLWDHSQAIVTAKLLQCQEKEQSFKLWYNIWRIPYIISKCFWNNLPFAYFYTQFLLPLPFHLKPYSL